MIDRKRYNQIIDDVNQEEFELLKLANEQQQVETYEDIKKIINTLKQNWTRLNDAEKKLAIRTLFESITVKVKDDEFKKNYDLPVLEVVGYELRK